MLSKHCLAVEVP